MEFQQINTNGHPAAGNVFVSVFDLADQQHFAYTDRVGNIWDSFYIRGQNKWSFQQINTSGHAPVGGVFVSAFHDQQHFVWKDGSGRIWDSFYEQTDNKWHFQEINTGGHPATSSIFVSVFGSADQQHFAYTDQGGNIWDAFYIRAQNKWSFQSINTAFNCMVQSGDDLTPDAGPCNGINKMRQQSIGSLQRHTWTQRQAPRSFGTVKLSKQRFLVCQAKPSDDCGWQSVPGGISAAHPRTVLERQSRLRPPDRLLTRQAMTKESDLALRP